jgi:hypothetical protein
MFIGQVLEAAFFRLVVVVCHLGVVEVKDCFEGVDV